MEGRVSKLAHMGGPPGRSAHNRINHTDRLYHGWLCLHVSHTYGGHTFWATFCPTCRAVKTQDVNSRAKWVECRHPTSVGDPVGMTITERVLRASQCQPEANPQ
jgi:hypothetical protein